MSTLHKMKAIGLCSLFVVAAFVLIPAMAGPDDDEGSVYNYAINWAVQTSSTEITVQVQARYCGACNHNSSGQGGCTAFGACFDGYGHQSCHFGRPDGTYIAVRLKDVVTDTVLDMKKLILQQGVNSTRGTLCSWQFIFSGLSVSAGQQVKVEADTYCSWCGHWYPQPVTMTVIGSDSEVTYTGDTSALVDTTANVCATLVDADTGDPLVGKTIKFTLNPTSPIAMVSAVTDASGVACTTMFIPPGTPAGIYTMDTRFEGDASYFPCSDQDDFEVIVKIPILLDIKPSSWPNPLNVDSKGVLPVAIPGTEDFDILEVDPDTLKLEGVDLLRFNYEDVCTADDQSKGPDGLLDLTLKFDKKSIVEAIGEVEDGEIVVLTLTGNLYEDYGGIPIEGMDVVIIRKK